MLVKVEFSSLLAYYLSVDLCVLVGQMLVEVDFSPLLAYYLSVDMCEVGQLLVKVDFSPLLAYISLSRFEYKWPDSRDGWYSEINGIYFCSSFVQRRPGIGDIRYVATSEVEYYDLIVIVGQTLSYGDIFGKAKSLAKYMYVCTYACVVVCIYKYIICIIYGKCLFIYFCKY